MKLGVSLGPGGAHLELPVALVQRAERLGYDCVWTSETYGADAITPLAYLAALTKTIRLGTGVAQLAARSPANLAMCAQTIDALAGGGRMVLGLGVSGPQIVEGWYGQPWGKPAARLRDYVAIMKKIWRRAGPVAHDGEEISLPYRGDGSSGLGKPLKSILHGNPDIPVLLGTATTSNIRMTGEIADGWLSMHLTPGGLRAWLEVIEQGLAKRSDGKTLAQFEIRASLRVAIDTDVKSALRALKPDIALYVGGMGAKGKNYHADAMAAAGYPEAAARIQELFLAGRKDEANDAVPDEYVDDQSLVGPAERIKERWRPWLDSGATMVAVGPATEEVVEAVAKAAL